MCYEPLRTFFSSPLNPALICLVLRFLNLHFILGSLAEAHRAIDLHPNYAIGPYYKASVEYDGTLLSSSFPSTNIHMAIQTPAYLFIVVPEILASIKGFEHAYPKIAAFMTAIVMSLS